MGREVNQVEGASPLGHLRSLRATAVDPKQTLLDDCSRPQADVYLCTTEMTRADTRLVTKRFDFSDVLNQKLQPHRQLPAT